MKRIVVSNRIFEIEMDPPVTESTTLSVLIDGRIAWSARVAGWLPWSCGVRADDLYLWTARQLLVFPACSPHSPFQLDFAEDLLLVFHVDTNWPCVCETSVRLSSDAGEIASINLGEVIVGARWEHDRLALRDFGDNEIVVSVNAGQLAVQSPNQGLAPSDEPNP